MIKSKIESKIIYNGKLIIDQINGIVIFESAFGFNVLRVTHLPMPIPDNVTIDMVAISNVTSYGTIEQEMDR